MLMRLYSISRTNINTHLHLLIRELYIQWRGNWIVTTRCCHGYCSTYTTKSTQRAQTSLAEADHYSHILPTVKMLSLGCERLSPAPPPPPKKKKKKKKSSGSLPAPRSGYATTIMVFFCSLTHLTIPRSPPKFNQFFLVLLWTPP